MCLTHRVVRLNDTRYPFSATPGLRGGVAVALAIEMVSDLSGKASARAGMSVTLGIAAFTILFLGGVSHDLVDRVRTRERLVPPAMS